MPQRINIISETPQVTFPRPGEPVTMIALTYQIEMGPPRTAWVEQTELPDLVYLATHPEATEAPADLVRQGDEARKVAIRRDIERRARMPTPRTMEL